jgi:hypothetical protein
LREWDVWKKHPEYNSVIALACKLPQGTVAMLERAGFVVDDGSRPAVKADQLFLLHARESLEKHYYWHKYDEVKAKYGGEEPLPVHLEELPELIIRFLGGATEEQCIRIADFALGELLKGK